MLIAWFACSIYMILVMVRTLLVLASPELALFSPLHNLFHTLRDASDAKPKVIGLCRCHFD